MAGHGRSKNGVASLAYGRSKNGVASLAYVPAIDVLHPCATRCGLDARQEGTAVRHDSCFMLPPA